MVTGFVEVMLKYTRVGLRVLRRFDRPEDGDSTFLRNVRTLPTILRRNPSEDRHFVNNRHGNLKIKINTFSCQ
jgi:hypothetical protein